jgi:uncharacterized membrane protein YeaQ/YmgE (transglycosylase-associated protein family)
MSSVVYFDERTDQSGRKKEHNIPARNYFRYYLVRGLIGAGIGGAIGLALALSKTLPDTPTSRTVAASVGGVIGAVVSSAIAKAVDHCSRSPKPKIMITSSAAGQKLLGDEYSSLAP